MAVAGLGFGAECVPIYASHPDVEFIAVCDSDPERLARTARKFGIARQFRTLEEVLLSDGIDAVHLVTGIPDHARQTLAVLDACKHCAGTVPMATRIADLTAIIAASRAASRNYMMMETAVRPFFYARELRDQGVFGRIQFLRGAHYQDMEAWPPYWAGLPPMWYATHAIAPLLAWRKRGPSRCIVSGRAKCTKNCGARMEPRTP